MSVKDDAIKQYREGKIEAAKEAFQLQVNDLLGVIHDFSRRLAEAKTRLRELEYKEPTFSGLDD